MSQAPRDVVIRILPQAGEEVAQLAQDMEQQALVLAEAQGLRSRLSELKAMLTEAHAGAERVRTIVRDLKVFSRQGEERRFDAIFCDLMMPGLSGMDLYERLQEQRPELTWRRCPTAGWRSRSRRSSSNSGWHRHSAEL